MDVFRRWQKINTIKHPSVWSAVPTTLVGGLEHLHTFAIFHNIWDVILPIDELIFLKMVKT
jgi:hypothetical protein